MELGPFTSICAVVPSQLPCAPCYIKYYATTLLYPSPVEATTVELIPLATIYPNGSTEITGTLTTTHGVVGNTSQTTNTLDVTVTAASDLTWTWSGLTLTYPTEYYFYDDFQYAPGETGTSVSVRQPTSTTVTAFSSLSLYNPTGCTVPPATSLTIPAASSALLYPIPVGENITSSPTGLPSPILSVVDQATVIAQLGADFTSCVPLVATNRVSCTPSSAFPSGAVETCTYAAVITGSCTDATSSSCQASYLTLLYDHLVFTCLLAESSGSAIRHATASILTTITGSPQLAGTASSVPALPEQTPAATTSTTSSTSSSASRTGNEPENSSGVDTPVLPSSSSELASSATVPAVASAPTSNGAATASSTDTQGLPITTASESAPVTPAMSSAASTGDALPTSSEPQALLTIPITLSSGQTTAIPIGSTTIDVSDVGSQLVVGTQTVASGGVVSISGQLLSNDGSGVVIQTIASVVSTGAVTTNGVSGNQPSTSTSSKTAYTGAASRQQAGRVMWLGAAMMLL